MLKQTTTPTKCNVADEEGMITTKAIQALCSVGVIDAQR